MHERNKFFTSRFWRFVLYISSFLPRNLNIFRNFGALAILSFIVCALSGIPLLFVYDVSPDKAYESVRFISQNKFWSFIRTLHRYSSDALLIFSLLHFLETFLSGKFRQKKTYIFGILLTLLIIVEGTTGFLLVWDDSAKVIGIGLVKFLTSVGFSDNLERTFFISDLRMLSGIFRISLIFHVFLSLIFLVFLGLHVMKLKKPVLLPNFMLSSAALLSLFLISLFFKSPLGNDAREVIFPDKIASDFLYSFPYLVFVRYGKISVFLFLFVFAFSLTLPFLFKVKTRAIIDLEKCNGCMQCFMDCPYNAIEILNFHGKRKARVNQSDCLGCGICFGSCESSAVIFPFYSYKSEKDEITIKCVLSGSDEKADVLVQCIGEVNPKIIDDSVRRVKLIGCSLCYFRLGYDWTEKRAEGKRRPVIKKETYLLEQMKRKKYDFLAPLLTILFILIALPLNSFDFKVFSGRVLILDIEYLSSPSKYLDFEGNLPHMKNSLKFPAERSSITVKVKAGNRLFSKKFFPSGIMRDGKVNAFEDLRFPSSITEIDLEVIEDASGKIVLKESYKLEDRVFLLRLRDF
jgi:Pyruvate/2-oxoacid:ferredoxin oxidoreductase delta subunit